MAALREEIRKHLQEGYDKRANQELQEQIFEKLLTESFEVPETMVQNEIEDIVRKAIKYKQLCNQSLQVIGEKDSEQSSPQM